MISDNVLHKAFPQITTLFFVTFLFIGLLGLTGCNNVPEIDMSGTSSKKTEQKSKIDEPRETLKVAVAAMISPKETRKYYNELIQLVGVRLNIEVELIQKKTYAEVNDLMEREEVNLAFVCSGPYVQGKEHFGMELLVAPVVSGQSVYYSYLISHKDSKINSLNDFKGKIFAFTDPMSNTGYMVPKYIVSLEGYSVDSFFGETFFTHGHDNPIKMVAEKVADGAAVDSLIWDFLDARNSIYTKDTKIVAKSSPYGIPPIVVHPNLDPDVKRKIKEVFLSLHQDSQGAAILEALNIEKFVDAEDSNYDSIRKINQWFITNDKD